MKVEFKDVYELLKQDLAYYVREIERREEQHEDGPVQRDILLYLRGQKRAIEMAMERLDLELNYGLGVDNDEEVADE